MKKLFKILFYFVIIAIVLIIITYLFMKTPAFGALPSGKSLEKVKASKNYIDGEFVSLSDAGYIVTDETMKTRTDKMYAIGDIREKDIRQIATATNDGVIAASFIMKEILKAKKK